MRHFLLNPLTQRNEYVWLPDNMKPEDYKFPNPEEYVAVKGNIPLTPEESKFLDQAAEKNSIALEEMLHGPLGTLEVMGEVRKAFEGDDNSN